MSRKIPVGYEVRRPLTLWGKRREIGEYLSAEEVSSLARIESMVRAGRFIEIYEKPEVKPSKRRGRPPKAVAEAHKPKPAPKPAPKPVKEKVVVVQPDDETPVVVSEPAAELEDTVDE